MDESFGVSIHRRMATVNTQECVMWLNEFKVSGSTHYLEEAKYRGKQAFRYARLALNEIEFPAN